jgi:SAM-dependent methyltransferase
MPQGPCAGASRSASGGKRMFSALWVECSACLWHQHKSCHLRDLESPLRVDDVQSLRRYVHSFLELDGGSAVLDLGCGRGTDLIAIGSAASSPRRLVGLDASAEAIQIAQEYTQGDPRYSFLLHDISQGLPYLTRASDASSRSTPLSASRTNLPS